MLQVELKKTYWHIRMSVGFQLRGVGPLLQRIVEVKRGTINVDAVLSVDGVVPA